MKRFSLLSLLLVMGAGLLMYAYADQEHGSRSGGGMGVGMAPGMEGRDGGKGYGTGFGMWPGTMPFWDKVPEDKQKQLEQLHRAIGPAMMRKMMETRDKAQQLRDIMHNFPIDQQAARTQWQTLIQAREQTFNLRLGMMSQMQQILGEQLWGQQLWGEKRGGWMGQR